MFFNHYGLLENPFGGTPDPRFLYKGRTHREALASLVYGTESGVGFQALIAQPGMGKTTLLFNLMDNFRSVARMAFLFQTQCSSRELLQYLFSELGADAPEHDVVTMHEKFNEILLSEFRAGRRVLVVIDEAQNLDASALETVRLLSDFETARTKLIQIVIAGQPQLAEKLAKPELTQLRQRISILSRLKAFGPSEVEAYIHHRLAVAGYCGPELFNPEALDIITAGSQGIPRNINNLCFNAMSLAFALERKTIDREIAREVIADLSAESVIEDQLSDFCLSNAAEVGGPSAPAVAIDRKFTAKCDATLQLMAEEARSVTGATGAAIGVMTGRQIVCKAAAGSTAPDLGMRLDVESGLSGECVRTGRVVHCEDTGSDPLVDANLCNHLGIKSVIAIPLYRENELVGLIEISSTQPQAFGEEDVSRLEHIAESISVSHISGNREPRPERVYLLNDSRNRLPNRLCKSFRRLEHPGA